MTDWLHLPKDVIYGLPLLSMTGNHCLCIQNHRGIRQYSDECIVVVAKNYCIQIKGKGLGIPAFSRDQIEITGIIDGIGFIP